MFEVTSVYWFAIRVSYGRVLKFCAHMQELGIECFVPMMSKKTDKGGKRSTVTVPAVSNLCFVRTTKAIMDDLFLSLGETWSAHFIWDKASRNPIVVSDKAMNDFMQINRVMADEVLYLKDITSKLQSGRKVRVLNGPFKGIEGTVLRVKKSRRVVVDFPGLLAIATTYIDPRDLELI